MIRPSVVTDIPDKLLAISAYGFIKDKIKSIEYEMWYKSAVSNNYGIWIGNGITEQFTMKLSKTPKYLYNDIPENFGYIIKLGIPSLVKLLEIDKVPDDDIEYIKRTIEYLQGYVNTKVIAFSLFPKSNYYEWAIYSTNSYFVNCEALYEKKKQVELVFKIPCIIFTGIEDIADMADIIVKFFSNDTE